MMLNATHALAKMSNKRTVLLIENKETEWKANKHDIDNI